MGITPMDIQDKEFERSFRGYDMEDVDEFLDKIAKDLEELIRENIELKDQISQLQEKNKSYQKLEETLQSAIVVAQETANEVKKNAKHEADLIRREADKEANRLVEEARYRASKILVEQEELYRKAQIFKMRFRSFMEGQLAVLESEDWINEPLQNETESERSFKGFEQEKSSETSAALDLLPEPVDELEPLYEPDSLYEPDPEYKLDQEEEEPDSDLEF